MKLPVGRRLLTFLSTVAMLFSIMAMSAPAVAASSVAAGKAPPGGIDTCGYSDATFNESEILYGIGVFGTGFNARIGMFLSDEKGLLLGVNGATPNTSNPEHVSKPSPGDLSKTDPSGRIFAPTIYVTDITNDPNSKAGDWQSGGTPTTQVDDVYGVWATGQITNGTYSIATLPAGKNNGNLGPGADPAPAGSTNQGYDAETAWNITSLHDQNGQPLQPGRTYRFQVIGHDGDQNKSGGDAGEACTTIKLPGQGLHATKTVDKATANPGDTLTYTITVTNPDPVAVTNVDISDDISAVVPGHGSLTGSNPSATVTGGNQLSWPNQTVPASGSLTFKYFVKLDATGWPAGTTTLPNVVVVTKSNCLPGSNDPDCHTTTIVTPQPHIKVVKTADAATVVAGNDVGFTITVTSDGDSTATAVALSDSLPTLANAGINWSISPTYSGPGSCAITGTPPSETLNCAFGDMAKGATASVHLTSHTTAPPNGTTIAPCSVTVETYATNLDNTVHVSSTNAASATANAGTCVTGRPHLTVTKTPDHQVVVAGNPVGFTITVASDGIGTANGVTLNDPLPTLANVGINWSISPAFAGPGTCGINGAPPSETLVCDFGNLASGQSRSVHVTSTTTAPTGGNSVGPCSITVTTYATNLDNTVSITSQNAGGGTAQAGICVTGAPHVKVVKTPDAQTVVAGNPVGFTITVTSDGQGTATNVNLNDPLPTLANAGISWSISPAYSGPGSCSITGGAPNQTLGCAFGDLAAGASASVHVSSATTAPAAGTTLAPCQVSVTNYATNLDNTVTITSSNAGSGTARTGVCVTGTPHILVSKTADAATVQAGNQLGFTIIVKSDGVGTANAVTLSDPLPTLAGLGINWSINPAYSGPGSCAINGAAPSQTLNCSFGDMASGSTVSIHVTSPSTAPSGNTTIAPCQVTVATYATNLDNTVTVTSQNAGSSVAKTGICIPQNPHLTVTKTADAQTVVAGNPVGFTITVKNDGTGTATGVTLSDPLPTLGGLGINWSINPAYAGVGTCAINGAPPSETLSCSIGDLPQGASTSVHVSSPTTAPAGGTTIAACQITVTTYATNLNNQVNVTSQNAGSATAQTGTCVTSTPHITVTKTPDAQSVLAGNPVGFTITVKSDGSGTVTNVTLSDPLPTLAGAGINWSINPVFAGPGTCSITGAVGGQTLSCNFGDLAAGTQASVHVTSPTTAPTGNTTLASCTISVTTFATNLNNSVQVTSANAGSATAQTGTCVTSNKNPAIHVVKIANPTLLPVGGGPVIYSYAVTNVGNVPLSNVTLVDDKCSPVVFLNGDTNGNAKLDLTETWHYSCTTTITVTTTNTVVATGHYIDPNDPGQVDHAVTDKDQATVVVPVPTPTPTGSVKGATSPPKPHVTLPPTDESGPLGSSGGQSGILMILILLAGIGSAIPILVFGKRRQIRR